MVFQNPATRSTRSDASAPQLAEILRWHEACRAGGARPGGGAASPGRHHRSRRAAAAVPARAERRHEAARRASPARCSATRRWCWRTSRRRRSTSRSRRRSSICWRSCASGFGMSMVLVTHDMGVVAAHGRPHHRHVCGPGLRDGRRRTIFARPQHPYTRALLESVPRIDHSYSGARPRAADIAGPAAGPAHPPRLPLPCALPGSRAGMPPHVPGETCVAPGHSVSCLRRG